MARGKVCPGHGPGQTALAGLGFGDLQRSRPLEQVGISYFLSKQMPTCVAFLQWARFFCLLDLLHCFQTQEHCVFYALSILDIALEDPLDFQAIIMVCFFLSFQKFPVSHPFRFGDLLSVTLWGKQGLGGLLFTLGEGQF